MLHFSVVISRTLHSDRNCFFCVWHRFQKGANKNRVTVYVIEKSDNETGIDKRNPFAIWRRRL